MINVQLISEGGSDVNSEIPDTKTENKTVTVIAGVVHELQDKIFGDEKFVTYDPKDTNVKRCNQILGFFFPHLRTSEWVSPV